MSVNELWSEKYRPTAIEDFVVEQSVKDKLTNNPINGNILLIGHHGIGKTSLAKLIPKSILNCDYIYINASDENGIETIRNKVTNYVEKKSILGEKKVIILDEADGISKPAQQALRNVMEEYTKTVIFILTANYGHNIIDPVKSRCTSYTINIKYTEIDFIKHILTILKKENVKVKGDIKSFIKNKYPDFRSAINSLQSLYNDGEIHIKDVNKVKNEFIVELWGYIEKSNIKEMTKFLINNTFEFDNDYHKILEGLFSYVTESETIDEKLKIKLVKILGNAERLHAGMLVPEQNVITCLVELKDEL